MDPRFRLLVHSRCHTHKRSYKKGLLWASLPESTHTKIDNSLTPTHTHTDFLFFSFFHLLLRPIFRLRSPAPKEKRIRASRFFFFLYCHFFFFFFRKGYKRSRNKPRGTLVKKASYRRYIRTRFLILFRPDLLLNLDRTTFSCWTILSLPPLPKQRQADCTSFK